MLKYKDSNHSAVLVFHSVASIWRPARDTTEPKGNNAHHLVGKLVATAQIPRALPLKWLTDVPKWVEQWPLPKVKLEALEQLVEKELQSGYIEPSTPPWNSHFCHLEKIW